MKDIRTGDTVHVRGVATEQPGGIYTCVKFYGADRSVHVMSSDIVHVEPRPPKVGDNVLWGRREVTGTIRGIYGTRAWVQIDETSDTIQDVSSLVRA